MKGYIKVELLLKVESGDLDTFQVEDWVLDEFGENKIHQDIKIVEKSIDALNFEEWEDWKDMYM